MEMVLAIAIFGLAAGGMALGLALGRGPIRTSCAASDRIAGARCADCPLRRRATSGDAP